MKIEDLYQYYIKANYQVFTDTRKVLQGAIFFALKGDNFDGNKFAEKAISEGASAAVIDNPKYLSDKTILVKDALASLQELAKYHRYKFRGKVFGLTGTNGKTTTKELIYKVLSSKYKCQATQGNLNNHIGVPLTLLSCSPNTEVLVVEMGANHRGEIKFLADMVQPDAGLITNIGKAHLEGFGGFDGVKKAKMELFENLMDNSKTIFYNDLDSLLSDALTAYKKKIAYGSTRSGLQAVDTTTKGMLSINLTIDGKSNHVDTKLFGNYNINNILAAASIGKYMQIEDIAVCKAIADYQPSNNRSQLKSTDNNDLIIDSYNANPTSMMAALKSFSDIKHPKKLLILGEMKELGENSEIEHTNLITTACQLDNTKIILCGTIFKTLDKNGCTWFESNEIIKQYLQQNNPTGYLILLKGSRSNKLEELIKYL